MNFWKATSQIRAKCETEIFVSDCGGLPVTFQKSSAQVDAEAINRVWKLNVNYLSNFYESVNE